MTELRRRNLLFVLTAGVLLLLWLAVLVTAVSERKARMASSHDPTMQAR